jgi:hypothetical protein
VETQQFAMKVAIVTLAAMAVVSLVGLLVLAAVRDGSVADQVISTIESGLQIGIPALATLAGVHSVVAGFVQSKQITTNGPTTPADGGNAA